MTPLSNTTERVELTLPWPDRALSPNGRPNRFAKARAIKAAKHIAWAVTLEALRGAKVNWSAVRIHWTFHPKTANSVDDDNAEASCKSFRDGIAKALGIDDAKFRATRSMGEPIKGGLVRVSIEAVTP